ncbi:ABC transporter ATP-binding protein/permease [Candidatus Parcubacteria bacterium]|nr:ABC transporter ATP-binding protein/permease [Candidatus Parcubacteria bacterium]
MSEPTPPTKKLPNVSMRQVISSYWQGGQSYWWLYSITVVCIISTALVRILNPLLYKQFFDIISSSTDKAAATPELIHIIVKVLVLNAILWLGFRIGTITDNLFQSWTGARMKQKAFDYLIEHSYSFFSNNFGGALVQKVNRYVRGFGKLLDQITWSILPLTINIIGVVIVVWRINPTFAGAILVWTLLFLLFNLFFSRYKSKYDLIANTADSKVTGYLADVITNSNIVQLFTGTKFESGEFRKATDDHAKKSIFAWNLAAIVDSVQASLIFILEFFVFYYAIRYWQQEIFTVGTFVLIQAYILGLGDRLWGFSRVIRAVYESYADGKEMVDIMTEPHEIKDLPGAKILHVEKGEIEYKELTFSFNETRRVLDHINLAIKPGEKVALIGPSGAGKSTFVRLLLRLYDPESGAILIDGQDIKYATQESLRGNISLVPQDPILFHRTLKENIRYGRRDATDEEVIVAAKLAHCDEFVKDLPLAYDTFVGERGIKLSGGERQRVAIARALLKNAPILILDEATSSLDSESESFIQDALDTLMKGKTTIVIAHRLSTIRKMDRIVVISDGKVLEEGSHDTLLEQENSLYRKLWNLQAGGFLKDTETV